MLNRRSQAFLAACLAELALLVLAAVGCGLFGRSPFSTLRWTLLDFLGGCLASVPPFAFFLWSLRTKIPPFVRHRVVMETLLRPIFAGWSMVHLGVISILAGICEETLFRGALQAPLANLLGPIPSLVVTSLLFGAAHPISRTYAIVAGGIGLYLGWLWLWTGNLLVPAVAHAAYDFGALVWFLKRQP